MSSSYSEKVYVFGRAGRRMGVFIVETGLDFVRVCVRPSERGLENQMNALWEWVVPKIPQVGDGLIAVPDPTAAKVQETADAVVSELRGILLADEFDYEAVVNAKREFYKISVGGEAYVVGRRTVIEAVKDEIAGMEGPITITRLLLTEAEFRAGGRDDDN